mmetsp:Transcript_33272/g.54063  ORF Transcript_33272/g.54063 Transcript_33272/m.54063 type:complete len:255 (+) Transcript_33272:44-808(+)
MADDLTFLLTDRMRSAMKAIITRVAALPHAPTGKEDVVKRLGAKIKRDDDVISFSDVREISEIFHKLRLEARDHKGYVHQLLKGSQIHFVEEEKKDDRDPDFIRWLEKMQIKADRELIFGPQREKDAGAKSVTMELGLGLNIILLMLSSFFVLYTGGQQAFPDSKIIPVLMGAAGLVGILIVETILIIARDEREELRRKKQKMDGSKKKRKSGSISSATKKNTQLLSSKTRRPSVSTSKQKRKETTASSRPKME